MSPNQLKSHDSSEVLKCSNPEEGGGGHMIATINDSPTSDQITSFKNSSVDYHMISLPVLRTPGHSGP